MRTIVFFALTCFISSFGALANLGNQQHPLLFAVILFGAWIPFVLHYRARQKRIDARRRRTYLQEQCMRNYLHNNGYRY